MYMYIYICCIYLYIDNMYFYRHPCQEIFSGDWPIGMNMNMNMNMHRSMISILILGLPEARPRPLQLGFKDVAEQM